MGGKRGRDPALLESVDMKSTPAPLTDEEEQLVARLAAEVVRRRMTVPAILFLESMKPLTFLGSQALHFFEPMVRTVTTRPEYRTAAVLLEDRDKIELLLRRIEALEAAGPEPSGAERP
jgi:hypothetical protein